MDIDAARDFAINAVFGDGPKDFTIKATPDKMQETPVQSYVEDNAGINKFKMDLLELMKKHNINLANPGIAESTALFMENVKRSR